MASCGNIEQMAQKFQSWAGSLSADEQQTLAEWWGRGWGDDVMGHTSNWWERDGAWAESWSASWGASLEK